MAMNDYMKAQRMGMKEIKSLKSAGQDPNLPCLEDIIRGQGKPVEVSIGTTAIPMDRIVGSVTPSRCLDFSASFYPLRDEKTEFAVKWARLATAHVSEGIRDPVLAVEYLNEYYIQEGHKRVSVLKWFGAPAVPATVVRLLPKRSEEPRILAYYEYVDFHRETGIDFIVFRVPGRYPKLLKLLNAEKEGEWDVFRRREVSACLFRFREALRFAGLEKELDVNECLLRYLEIYGYTHLHAQSPSELRSELDAIVPELRSGSRDMGSDLMMEPEEKPPAKSLLERIIRPEEKQLRVAFLHDKNPKNSHWTAAHEQGRQTLQERMGERVESVSFFDMLSWDPLDKMRELAEAGYDVVFTTTPRLLEATLKAAAEYPETKFLNCSLNIRHPLVRTYYGRMFEAKFLTGVIAGALSENGRLGYICNYPIYGMAASINAFALGARMTRPDAKIYLEWTTIPGSRPEETLKEKGVTVVSGQDTYVPEYSDRDFGLFLLKDGEKLNVAQSVWRWGNFYERIIRSIPDGSWSLLERTEESGKAINYWWGLASGVIDVDMGREVPVQTHRLVELLRRSVSDGSFQIFRGPILDNEGRERISEGEQLSPWDVVHMDYLVEGVLGHIPEPESLTENARALLRIQGLHTPPEDQV